MAHDCRSCIIDYSDLVGSNPVADGSMLPCGLCCPHCRYLTTLKVSIDYAWGGSARRQSSSSVVAPPNVQHQSCEHIHCDRVAPGCGLSSMQQAVRREGCAFAVIAQLDASLMYMCISNRAKSTDRYLYN